MKNKGEHQFGELVSRMQGGGFTYNPRTQTFPESGISVAAHPGAELKVPHSEGGASLGDIRGFVKGSQPIWSVQHASGKGQEHIGGWRDESEHKDVLDLPKVFPETPSGHMKSRQAVLLRNQEASFHLSDYHTELNPYHAKTRENYDVHGSGGPEEQKLWSDLPVEGRKYDKRKPGPSTNLLSSQMDGVSFS
jgi:hypothetical protein